MENIENKLHVDTKKNSDKVVLGFCEVKIVTSNMNRKQLENFVKVLDWIMDKGINFNIKNDGCCLILSFADKMDQHMYKIYSIIADTIINIFSKDWVEINIQVETINEFKNKLFNSLRKLQLISLEKDNSTITNKLIDKFELLCSSQRLKEGSSDLLECYWMLHSSFNNAIPGESKMPSQYIKKLESCKKIIE